MTENKVEVEEPLERYYHSIKAFIFSFIKDEWIAEDLTQETFIRSQKYSHDIRDRTKVKSWLFRVAYNICQDHFRQENRQTEKNFTFAEQIDTANQAKTADMLEQHEMSQCMQKQMLLLPKRFRTILWLFDVDGFKHREIADILGISEANVKVHLHRARKKFSSILLNNCTFEKDNRNILVCLPK